MWRKVLFLALAIILVVLVASSSVHAWGCYHASYHYGGYGGGYHAGYTHYSPYTGNVQHYSTTAAAATAATAATTTGIGIRRA
jgi:hypothetical protein